jgi:hypothetical protein
MKKPKTLPKLKQDAQKLFNAFIRRRDEGKPCISCGQYRPSQAGHYYPVKNYDGLRFDEDNVHGECSGCNCFDQSHLIGYGENLLIRIGPERFDALKQRAAEYKRNGYKFSRTELLEIIERYR